MSLKKAITDVCLVLKIELAKKVGEKEVQKEVKELSNEIKNHEGYSKLDQSLKTAFLKSIGEHIESASDKVARLKKEEKEAQAKVDKIAKEKEDALKKDLKNRVSNLKDDDQVLYRVISTKTNKNLFKDSGPVSFSLYKIKVEKASPGVRFEISGIME